MRDEPICNAIRNLGDNLKFISEKKGLNIKEFATEINYDRVCLGRLFWGEQNMKLSTANRIAEKTGYSLSGLLNISFREDAEYRKKEKYEDLDLLKVFLNFVGKKMKEERLTPTDIICKTEMDKAALSKILNGQIMNPTLVTMDRISRAVGYELSIALKEDNE